MKVNKYICPICGYDKLKNNPTQDSYEICPCCGYEFGSFEYNKEDISKYFPKFQENPEVFSFIRNQWIGNNFTWWSKNTQKPKNWNPISQLNNLQNYLFKINKNCGGFAELQYCDKNIPLNNLLDYKNITHWKPTSLFIESGTHAESLFNNYYATLFNNSNLSNNKTGFDYFGINYYNPKQTLNIYNKIKKLKNMPDKEVILNWLKTAIEKYNGFYYLGI